MTALDEILTTKIREVLNSDELRAHLSGIIQDEILRAFAGGGAATSSIPKTETVHAMPSHARPDDVEAAARASRDYQRVLNTANRVEKWAKESGTTMDRKKDIIPMVKTAMQAHPDMTPVPLADLIISSIRGVIPTATEVQPRIVSVLQTSPGTAEGAEITRVPPTYFVFPETSREVTLPASGMTVTPVDGISLSPDDEVATVNV